MAQICTLENLELADKKARQGKKRKYGIRLFDRNRERNLEKLHEMLQSGNYKTSEYVTFMVHDPKEREIFRLPYYPDRICHHAIMNIIEPIFVRTFTRDTYACIKGRGIHAASDAIMRAMKMDREGTKYCLKLDVHHYYPSIKHDILKAKVRKIIKDRRLLNVMDEIIDSAEGLPIGNYLSQYLANLYLSDFDHWIKEVLHVKHYFRYVDDIVILSDSKEFLHGLLRKIEVYLQEELELEVKGNWQVFPVEARGLDFLGYVFRHDYVRLRKRVKLNIKKKLLYCIKKGMTVKEIHDAMGSYQGWMNHCNARNYIKLLNQICYGKVFQ